MWRVMSSGRIKAGLVEIENQWSIDDLADANDVLDAYDEAERRADLMARARNR